MKSSMLCSTFTHECLLLMITHFYLKHTENESSAVDEIFQYCRVNTVNDDLMAQQAIVIGDCCMMTQRSFEFVQLN